MVSRPVWSLVLVLSVFASRAYPLGPGPLCEKTVADALRKCVKKVAKLEQKCFQKTGADCVASDEKVLTAYAGTTKKLLAKCPDQATVTAAGYSPLLTTGGLDARVRDACENAAATFVARSYGGPLGSARAGASQVDQKCLDNAFTRSLVVLTYDLQQQSKCVRDQHAGKPCDTVALAAKIAKKEASSTESIAARCPTPVETLVAVDAATQVSRAAAQSRCLTASAHPDNAPLALDCGPRAAVPVPARGTPTQIVLPSAVWGTRCGDGSDYKFWLRLAPTGDPLDRTLIFMQGGGACYDGPSCSAAGAQRFNADDPYPGGGIFKPNDLANPFRDWNVVFLPYCTQDLHIGGGVTNVFPEITVYRYGAINARTAIAYARDAIWSALDATDSDGYRGNRMTALLAGGSAGAYGDAYNYHWVLDELRWPRTTAAPDSGLGMDNGQALGVIALGILAITPTTPGWNSVPYLPAYCMTQQCAEILDNLHLATAPRLKRLPEQQVLTISNQVDDVQRSTTLFANTATWLNTLRTNYCSAQGGTGLHYFFSAQTATQHTQMNGAKFYSTVVGGTSIAQWLGDAIASPDTVIDKVATGTLETDIAGLSPFPCAIGSPSGAFVD